MHRHTNAQRGCSGWGRGCGAQEVVFFGWHHFIGRIVRTMLFAVGKMCPWGVGRHTHTHIESSPAALQQHFLYLEAYNWMCCDEDVARVCSHSRLRPSPHWNDNDTSRCVSVRAKSCLSFAFGRLYPSRPPTSERERERHTPEQMLSDTACAGHSRLDHISLSSPSMFS